MYVSMYVSIYVTKSKNGYRHLANMIIVRLRISEDVFFNTTLPVSILTDCLFIRRILPRNLQIYLHLFRGNQHLGKVPHPHFKIHTQA